MFCFNIYVVYLNKNFAFRLSNLPILLEDFLHNVQTFFVHLAACPGGSDCLDCKTSKSQKCDMCSNRKYWDATSSTCSSKCQQPLQPVQSHFGTFKQKSCFN